MPIALQTIYFLTAIGLIVGLKQMSLPQKARQGIRLSGYAMLLGILATFWMPDVQGIVNVFLILTAIVLGSWVAAAKALRVAMTDLPQMIALYNGMGGGAAALIAAVEWLGHTPLNTAEQIIALLGAWIGMASLSGSLVAYLKLQGTLRKTWQLPQHRVSLIAVFFITLGTALWAFRVPDSSAALTLFYIAIFIWGMLITLPIGGANMPVVISLLNAMTGLAVGFEGYVLENPAMMIAGVVVGAAGTLLTQLMAQAMNQSLWAILFPETSGTQSDADVTGTQRATTSTDAGILLRYASRVIIIPGYGLAVAQAQYKLWEMTELLKKAGVHVQFAIHPVAGRMPGHMNVLLAEAGVPYEDIHDLDDINAEFEHTDVALVIGANDVVNPLAEIDPQSPIYGMPILKAHTAQNVLIIKRGQGKGFSGIVNPLFFEAKTQMVYGDAQAVLGDLITAIKAY